MSARSSFVTLEAASVFEVLILVENGYGRGLDVRENQVGEERGDNLWSSGRIQIKVNL